MVALAGMLDMPSSSAMHQSCNSDGVFGVQDSTQPETHSRFAVIDGAIVMC